MTPSELSTILVGISKYSHVEACIKACQRHFPDDWGTFVNSVFNDIISIFSRVYFHEDDRLVDWASLVADAMARGSDVYSNFNDNSTLSTLNRIMRHQESSEEALESVHRWVDMLDLAGVDTERYLQIETQRCLETWGPEIANTFLNTQDGDSNIRRILTIQYSRGRRIPYWTLEIDDQCPIRDLLTGFSWTLRPITRTSLLSTHEIINKYKAWKNGQTLGLSDPSMKSWPIIMSPQRDAPFRSIGGEDSREAIEWMKQTCDLIESRFNRKSTRKTWKAGRQERSHKLYTVPGSWVH